LSWIDVPTGGAYVSWGSQAGQHVTGTVVSFDKEAGSSFDGTVVPHLEVELSEPTHSIDKDGEVRDFDAGDIVSLNCGQAQLKKALSRIDLRPGDKVRIELTGTVKTPKGTGKAYKVGYEKAQLEAATPF
jgi:hypothetical protein